MLRKGANVDYFIFWNRDLIVMLRSKEFSQLVTYNIKILAIKNIKTISKVQSYVRSLQ